MSQLITPRSGLLTPALARAMRLHGAQGLNGFAGAEGGYLVNADANRTVSGTGLTVDGQPLNEIWSDLQSRLAAFNRQMDFKVAILTFPVARAQEKVGVYYTPRFEEATEFGRPEKVRLQYVSRGFPLNHYDLGYGYTQEFIDSARGAEIRAVQAQIESGWSSLLMRLVLTALFTAANATDEDGLSVKRLYNNDGEVPPPYKRWSHLGTHTHYLTSAALDLAAIRVMYEHLLHHGYGDFGEQIVGHVNRTQMSVLRGLAGWVPAESSTVASIVSGPVVGQRGSVPSGLVVQGYLEGVSWVEDNDIPANYVLMYATAGVFAQQNIVGLRSHENPSIRGLRLIEGNNTRYPLTDSVYDGYTGAGIRHRGAAVITQITGGAYASPTI